MKILQDKNNSYDELDLKEVFNVIWSGRVLISTITFLFLMVSVVFALSLPNQYRATAIVTPVLGGGGAVSGVLGRFGGLASLAGVGVGGAAQNEALIARHVMQSRGFIEKFIHDYDLGVKIYAASGWDKKTNTLKYDSSVYNKTDSSWIGDNAEDVVSAPSDWKLYRKFSGMFTIVDDPANGVISVSVEHYSPHVAKELVDKLIAGINDHLKEQKLARVNLNIHYLEAQIEKTPITEMREVFYSVVEEQIKSKMLAEASPEYAFMTVSPAMIPELRSRPMRTLICAIGAFTGLLIGTVLVLFRGYF